MAKLVINIPQEEVAEFIDFVCEDNDYPLMVPDPNDPADFIVNDYPKTQYAREALTKNLKMGFENWKRIQIAKAATASSGVNVTSEA